jgi:hypothetical protein
VDRLHVSLDRVLIVERRAVAAAFDKVDTRHFRIARKRVEREHQRLPDKAVNRQPMFRRIDIRNAGARHHEVQAGRRDAALKQMVRGARIAGARLVFGIGQRAHDLALVFRGRPIGRDCCARRLAPGIDRQRVGGSAGRRAGPSADCSGKDDATPQQGAAIDQAVAGHDLGFTRFLSGLPVCHQFLLRGAAAVRTSSRRR